MKLGGKEVGPAKVYAQPHDMSGRAGARMEQPMGAETLKDGIRMSVGSIGTAAPEAIETSGIVARGVGAATKGKMARGPMG